MSRPRVLVFAYACDPTRGSELGAGAAVAKAIASISSDVVVITRHEEGLHPVALGKLLGPNVQVVRVGLRSNRFPTYAQYLIWLILAAGAARRLRSEEPFNTLHHLTYASDWFVNPLVFLRKKRGERWIWGPAGGSSYAPHRVSRKVTNSWATPEWARAIITRPVRAMVHRSLFRRVDVAIALNADTHRAFKCSGFEHVVTQTNAVIPYDDFPEHVPPAAPLLVYAGRGVPWKGLSLVLESMQHLPSDWTLIVAGAGSDSERYQALAQSVSNRVTFVGSLSRSDLFALLARASAFALPSLHDSAGWAAAEAAGIGIPVVCLDLGGVSSMAGDLASVVAHTPVRNLPERFAEAVQATQYVHARPSRDYTEAALRSGIARIYSVSNQP